MLIVSVGIVLIVIGLIASGLDMSKYLVPYAGRFGYPINGAGVVIWILMVLMIKRKASERNALLSGIYPRTDACCERSSEKS